MAVLWLVGGLGAVASIGCQTTPAENRAPGNEPWPPGNQTVEPDGPFNSTIAGRHHEDLPDLTRAQHDDFREAIAALQQGDYPACVALLQPLVSEAGRDDEWILNNLGTALIALGKEADALQVLGDGLDRYPDNGLLHYNQARALDRLDRATEAIAHYVAYLGSPLVDREPTRTHDAIARLADALRNDGRIEECIEALETGRQRFPESPLFVELLAEVYFDRGEPERFRELADVSVELLEEGLENLPDSLTATGEYRLPLPAAAILRRGPESLPGHFGARQRFAVDLLPLDVELRARPDGVPLLGSDVRDWVGFGVDVLAARDGVVAFVDDRNEDQARTGMPDEVVWSRPNRIVIRHDNNEISEYAHLQQGSAMVAVGDRVTAGQSIARVGCSGMRPVVPHLGFRVAHDDGDTERNCLHHGLRFAFANIEIFHAESAWSAPTATEPTLPPVDTILRGAR